jgi:hypothetical protein
MAGTSVPDVPSPNDRRWNRTTSSVCTEGPHQTCSHIFLYCDWDHTKVHRAVLFSAHENGSHGYDLQIMHPQTTGLHHCDAGLHRGVRSVRVNARAVGSKCSARRRMAMQQDALHDELRQGCSRLAGDRSSTQRRNLPTAGIIPPATRLVRGRNAAADGPRCGYRLSVFGTNFLVRHFSSEAVTRRSIRRLSRIAKGLRTRCS